MVDHVKAGDIPGEPTDPVQDIVMSVAKCYQPGHAKTLRQIADEIRPAIQKLIRDEVAAFFENDEQQSGEPKP